MAVVTAGGCACNPGVLVKVMLVVVGGGGGVGVVVCGGAGRGCTSLGHAEDLLPSEWSGGRGGYFQGLKGRGRGPGDDDVLVYPYIILHHPYPSAVTPRRPAPCLSLAT